MSSNSSVRMSDKPIDCSTVEELRQAVSFVNGECELLDAVRVNYGLRGGEGVVEVGPTKFHMLHILWTACVGKSGYDKSVWRAVESQLQKAGVIE